MKSKCRVCDARIPTGWARCTDCQVIANGIEQYLKNSKGRKHILKLLYEPYELEQLKSTLTAQELSLEIRILVNGDMKWIVSSSRSRESYHCAFTTDNDMMFSDVLGQFMGPAVIIINKLRGEA